MCKKLVKALTKKKLHIHVVWTTTAGTFNTTEKVELNFSLPGLNPSSVINTDAHVVDTLGDYGIILGRDLLERVGIDILFSTKTIEWGQYSTPIKPVLAKE